MSEAVLECRTCGEVLRTLTPHEAQMIALEPYRFIVDCADCAKEIMRDLIRKERAAERGRDG